MRSFLGKVMTLNLGIWEKGLFKDREQLGVN